MKAEARKNICCRKYSELQFRELMNTVGLSLVQNYVGGTLSSADSMVGDPSMEIFFNSSEKMKKEYLEGKGLIWRVRMSCWTQIKLLYGFRQI